MKFTYEYEINYIIITNIVIYLKYSRDASFKITRDTILKMGQRILRLYGSSGLRDLAHETCNYTDFEKIRVQSERIAKKFFPELFSCPVTIEISEPTRKPFHYKDKRINHEMSKSST